MNQSEVMPTVSRILRTELGACPEADVITGFYSPQDAYEGCPSWQVWWWIEHFVQDPRFVSRSQRLLMVVDQFFADLCKIHYAATGTPTRVPEQLKDALRRRLLHALMPFVDEIVDEAKTAPATQAAEKLKQFIREDQWRARSL